MSKLIPKLLSAWTPIYRTNVNSFITDENKETLLALARATEVYRNGEIDEKQQQKDKIRQAFTNLILAGAMAEDPEMMIASGWRQNEDGNFVLDLMDDPGVKALRNNLAVLGATTLAAPAAGYMIADAAAMGLPWWGNFVGDAAAGVAGGIATDAVYKGLTGKSWAQGVRDMLPEGPKWIPDETKTMLAEMTNPGGWLSFGAARLIGNGFSNVADNFTRFGNNLFRNRKAAKVISETLDNTTPVVKTVDDAKVIHQTSTTPKVEGNTYLGMLERPSTLSDAELKGVTKHDRKRVIRTNPLAGVDSDVNTYLINRSDTPLEFVDGTSVWFPGGSKAGKNRATVHFTTDRPVIGHTLGSWNTASETLLTPYAQIVKDNGFPLNIDPMDTYFSLMYPFVIRQDGSKIFTSNPHNYRRYKAQGVDVSTDEEAQILWKEIQELQEKRRKLEINYKEELTDPNSEAYAQDYLLAGRIRELANRHNRIHKEWVKQNNPSVDINTYKTMESETGLSAGVMLDDRNNRLLYYPTPESHSSSWYYDDLTPQQQYDKFLLWFSNSPEIITDLDVQMFQRLLLTHPDLMQLWLLHIKFKTGGKLIPKYKKA